MDTCGDLLLNCPNYEFSPNNCTDHSLFNTIYFITCINKMGEFRRLDLRLKCKAVNKNDDNILQFFYLELVDSII